MKIQNFSSWLIYRQREKEKVTMMMKNKVTMVKGVCDATGGSKELIFPLEFVTYCVSKNSH